MKLKWEAGQNNDKNGYRGFEFLDFITDSSLPTLDSSLLTKLNITFAAIHADDDDRDLATCSFVQ